MHVKSANDLLKISGNVNSLNTVKYFKNHNSENAKLITLFTIVHETNLTVKLQKTNLNTCKHGTKKLFENNR